MRRDLLWYLRLGTAEPQSRGSGKPLASHWQVMLKPRFGFRWSEAGFGHLRFRLAKADSRSRAKGGSVWIALEREQHREAHSLCFTRVLQLGGSGAR